MSRGALKFKNLVAKQPQELGRLRIIGGPEAGAVFVITAPRVTIGRGEECEIAVMDLKMSRRHAELSQTNQGVLIKDLGSSNGLLINGTVLKQWFLRTGDKVGIGSSVFEYISPEGMNQMMMQPSQPVAATKNIATGASGLTKFIMLPGKAQQGSAASQAEPNAVNQSMFEKNKKFVLTLLAVIVLASLMPQAEMQVKKRRKKYEPPTEVSQNSSLLKNFLPQVTDTDARKKAESYFNEGYREFIEKNYLRAKSAFDVTLQVLPSHELARVYRDKTIKAMEEEAKLTKGYAKRDEEANRLKSALNRYDDIRRLYFRDQSNPIYKEADESYKRVEKKLKESEL